MSILGLDWGQRFVGYATADNEGILITPRGFFERKVQAEQSWQLTRKDTEKIKNLLEEWEVEKFVLGLPLNADGSENEQTSLARALAHKISEVFNVDCIATDERLTSWEAGSGNNHAKAAALILSNYFQNRKAL